MAAEQDAAGFTLAPRALSKGKHLVNRFFSNDEPLVDVD